LLWFAHIVGLWKFVVDSKKKHQGTKEDRWWHTIVVCAQVIKNETKRKWKHPHVSIIRGMKSSHGVCSMYDHVFTWASIIVTCAIVVDVCYTIYVRVGSTMIMSIKVRKLFMMRRISIRHWVWQGKRWEISFWTCVPFSKTIVAIVSRSVSWAVVCSLSQEHRNEWVRRSSMVWSHWHHKKKSNYRMWQTKMGMGCYKEMD
jgi:hypothetical protein